VIWSPSNANYSRSLLFGSVPFTHTGVRGTFAVGDTLNLIAGINNGWDQLVARLGSPTPARVDPESLAVLLYTSGTSGRPRAAMLSHRALLANIEQVAQVDPLMITGQDVVMGVLPLFHVYGLNAVLGQVLRQHARLVLVNGFDSEGSLDLIEDEAISVVPVAPPVFAYWMQVPGLEDRLGPVRLVLSGSAPLAPELTDAFSARTGVAVHQGYGLTEAAPGVSATLGGELLGRGHVGRPLPGVEIKIGDGTDPTEPGEIWIRGGNMFSGYWPDGRGGPDEDGWFPTGDVGYLLDGELFLVDRSRELIIVDGFNVYPAEVEAAISELVGVESVAAVGRPDWRSGEQVVAFVSGAGLSPAVINEHCANRLAKFKRPRHIQIVDELPRGITGKVRKGVLRDMS